MVKKQFKKNFKSNNNRPDIRLQVLRCSLLDFVAVFLCLAVSFMEVSAYAERFRKEERETGEPEKVQFIVTREFSGSQTMQEAFEQLIERQACGQFEEWLGRKAG